jgi:putative ABC transport system permease protein
MKHLLIESVVLAVAAGIAGVILAWLSLASIQHIAGTDLPRSSEIQFSGPVLAFAIALSLVTTFLFGFAPSLSAARTDLMLVLRTGRSSSARTRLRSVLVGAQVAFSLVLLICASLLMESILHLQGEPLGFDSQNLLTARITLPPNINSSRFFENLLAGLSSLPGVEHASISLSLPMTTFPGTPVQDASQPILPLNERPLTALFIVSPDYFQTLRVPLKKGRSFTLRDREGTTRVAVIDEGLARHLWPDYPGGQNPIGQHILVGGVVKTPAEVIGVVGNVHQNIENAGWGRSVYLPFTQAPIPSAMIAVRLKDNPLRFSAALRRAVQSLNPAQPLSDVQPMQDLVESELGPRRVMMQVLVFFALVAFALALVGLYGLISYSVSRRTQELGVRRALGATRSGILLLILEQVLRLTAAGIAAGAITAMIVTRLLKTYLFHVAATSPATFVGVSIVFLAVALAAAIQPALRAANIEPVRALRYE